MPYGTIKIDTITFTDGGVDKSVPVSGLVQNPTFTGNVTVTGTISGNIIQGGTTVSGLTVTGTTANFASGVFTTQISGVTITGTTVAATTGTFTSLTGTTTNGTTASFTTGNFTSLTGTTTTGTTANFASGVFTTRVSGLLITGPTVSATTGNFTSLTGTTTTGTTANFASGVFTTQISGVTITGTTISTTTGNFTSLTGTTATITSGIIASGTAALPSLAILSDPNTGIYSPGADQLAVATNGSQRLLIDSGGITSANGGVFSGDVASYAVQGLALTFNSNNSEIRACRSGGNYSNLLFFTPGANSGGAQAERVRITSEGLVGIGSSMPSSDGPLTLANAAETPTIFFSRPSGGSFSAAIQASSFGTLTFYNGAVSSTVAGLTPRMTIDGQNGRVGIGTTSPLNNLHIEGTSPIIRLTDTTPGAVGFIGADANGLYIRTFGVDTFRILKANGTESFRSDASGRLLVGTSSASGVNSNTAPVLAGNFASFTGSVSANHNTATTLFTLEDLNATYMVTAVVTGSANATAYHAVYIIGSVVTNSHSIQALKAGSLLTLSLSGANVQATQGSGLAQTVTWSVTRMANL